LVFLLESSGFSTGIDLDKLIAARAVLREGLPNEPMYGNLARAGVPKTFAKAA
jgi:hydroxymethylglutaryl-CoA lyase